MLDIVMESAKILDSTQVSERATLEEVTVPQRSITDFFKSPPKPTINKPTTLLGYFKGKECTTITPDSQVQTKGETKISSKKRKRNTVDDLDNSINDFQSTITLKTGEATHKKVKSCDDKRNSKKASTGNKLKKQELCGSSENHSEKENEDLPRSDNDKPIPETSTISTSSRNRLSVNKKKSKKEAKQNPDQKGEHTSEVVAQSPVTVLNKNRDKRAEKKSKRNKTSESSSTQPKTEQTTLSQGSDGNITVEVSYEDFLKSEGILLSQPDLSECEEEQAPELTVPNCRKVLDYFKKKEPDASSKSGVENGLVILKDQKHEIVTTADVHCEPSPTPPKRHTQDKLNCDNDDIQVSHILLSDEECDMDILEISSEIIEISPFKPDSKVNKSKILHSADCGRNSEIINKSAVENVITCQPASELESSPVRLQQDQVTAQKTAQARLCFTKKGLGMKKARNSGGEKVVTDMPSDKSGDPITSLKPNKFVKARKTPDFKLSKRDTKSSKRKLGAAGQKARSKISEADVLPTPEEGVSKFTPRRSPRTRLAPVPTKQVSEVRKSVKKILRGRYKVAQLQPGCDNRSPIRIRLRRCSKSSGEDEESTKSEKKKSKKVKLTKAQQLVEKAKKKRNGPNEKPQKGKTGSKDSKGKPDVTDKKTITDKDEKNTKKPVKPKNTEKLAPIFTKKKAGDTPKMKPALDPEIVRQRQEFLKSSLPENLKRHCALAAPQQCSRYPPIPRCSHVQQIPSNQDSERLNVWELPGVHLNLTDEKPCSSLTVENLQFNMTQSRLSHEPLRIPKTFSRHTNLSEKVVEVLLKEIQRNNPNFPVQHLYKCYKMKREETESKELQAGEILTPTESTSEQTAKPLWAPPRPTADCPKTELKEVIPKTRSTRRQASSTSPTNTSSLSLPRANRLRRSRRSKESAAEPKASETTDVKFTDQSVQPSQDNIASQSNNTDKPANKVRELLWQDKYHPSQSLEIIGNSGNVKKLKSWLQQWKERTDKEARRLKKLLRKQQKKLSKITEQESNSDWWTDDDSDFADTNKADSDWMETEEDLLCNTMLMTGPIGIGKTSTVYALAQELGYQVFEVNATSSRTGKKILGKLQEATQSHQVSKQSVGGSSTPGKAPLFTGSLSIADSPVKPAKMPTAFTNLFTKKTNPKTSVITIDDSSQKKPAKSSGAKRKRPSNSEEKEIPSPKKKVKTCVRKLPIPESVVSTESNSSSTLAAKGLNLSSTSLILFDEVDVVFEEDKGFWAAIQSFMNISKRPIILTTADGRFWGKFEGRFEQLVFKNPSFLNIVTCLQLICLTENVRTEFSDLLNLVEFHRGDLRKCMQCLQYWVESGGGILQETQPGLSASPAGEQFLLEDEVSQCPEASVTPTSSSKEALPGRSCQASNDRSCTTTGGILSQLRVVQDDSSVDSFQSSPCKKPQKRVPEVDLMDENAMFPSLDDLSSCTEDLPYVHRLCVESLIGSTSYSHTDITDLLTGECNQSSVSVYKLLKDSGIDLRLSNLELLLPLPVSLVDSTCWPVGPQDISIHAQVDKPEKPVPDSCASDSSDTEWVFEKNKKPEVVDNKPPVWKELRDQLSECLSKEQRNCLGLSIEAMSDLYEMGSYLDSLCINSIRTGSTSASNRWTDLPDLDRTSILPGLTDELRSENRSDQTAQKLSQDIAAEVTVRSLNKCCEQLESVNQTATKLKASENLINQLSLPVLKGYHQLRLSEDWPIRSLTMSSRKKAMENVISSLPLHMWSQTRSLSLDYVPVLRSICAAEQIRHISKTKRRFLHYLDGISLPIKEFTMNVLGTSLK